MKNQEELEREFSRAVALTKALNIKGAIECYERITAAHPQVREAWANQALLYEAYLDDPERAVACYLKATYLKPTDLLPTRRIAELLYRMGRYGRARYWFQKLVDWRTGDPSVVHFLRECEGHSQRLGLVFVSYARADRAFVDNHLLPTLARARIEYFIDRERMVQDEHLPELRWQLEQGLGESDVVVLVWSKASVESQWVKTEYTSALAMEKGLVPVLIDGTPLPASIASAVSVGRIAPVHARGSEIPPDTAGIVNAHEPVRADTISANDRAPIRTTWLHGIPFHWILLRGGRMVDFAILRAPVTQRQWLALIGTNPSHFADDPQKPVESVSWADANEYARRYSQSTGVCARLPTDTEWEFACRAGGEGNWCFGNDEDELPEYAWFQDNPGRGNRPATWLRAGGDSGKVIRVVTSPHATNPVETRRSNRWGIYDMHGNVYEWCADDSLLRPGYKSIRGGAFCSGPRELRSAAHECQPPDSPLIAIGFRMARTVLPNEWQ